MKEIEGLRFLYETRIAGHLGGKVIDYIEGEQSGFTITDETGCGGCSGC